MKAKTLSCFICNSPASYKYNGRYYCSKHYEEIRQYGEEVFNSPLIPGGYIQLQSRNKVNHSWRDFERKPRMTKKDKLRKTIAEAELIL